MADRFYITAEMNLLPPSNLKQVVNNIKNEFKSIGTIDAIIKTPNLADFKRKMKEAIGSIGDVTLKIGYPSGMPAIKKKLAESLKTSATVPIRLVISKSAEATILRLSAKLKKAATLSIKTDIAPGISDASKSLGALKNLSINVRGDAAARIGAITSSLRVANSTIQASTNEIEKFGAQSAYAVRRYGAFTVVASSFYALFGAIRTGIGDAVAFEKEMIKIRQVTGFATRDLDVLSNEVTRLATGFGVSSQKILNAAQTLAQAGYATEDIKKALEALAKTDVSATFEDIGQTTEGVIAILAQFGGGINRIEQDLSAVNTVSAKFAVESSDIITAVRRTGGAFQAAGGNLNELIGLFTSVRATTRESAESIATGFRTIFTRLQRVRTQNFLSDLGIQLQDMEGQFIGPYKAIEKLSQALSKVKSTDPRFAQIVEELGGFRQVSKVIPLIEKFNVAVQAKNIADRSSNSLTEDAAKAQDSLANKLQKLKEKFDALIRSITNSDTFKNMSDSFLHIASSVIKLTDALGKLLPAISAIGGIGLSKAVASYGKGFTGKSTPGGGLSTDSFSNFTSAGILGASAYQRNKQYAFGNRSVNTSQTNIGLGAAGLGLIVGPLAAQLKNFGIKLDEGGQQFADSIGNIVTQFGLFYYAFSLFRKKIAEFNTGRTLAEIQPLRRERTQILNTHGPLSPGQNTRLLFLRKEITERLHSAASTNRMANSFSVAGAAAIAFGAVLNEVSNHLDKIAEDKFVEKNYEGYRTTKTASAGITGGINAVATAAPLSLLIGMLFNPLAGIFITGGALIAGAISGMLFAWGEATKKIETARFEDRFKKTAGYLNAVTNGRADPLSSIGAVELASREARDRLATTSGADYETTKGIIDSSIVDLDLYVKSIARTKTSFTELDGVLHSSILNLSRFTNVPFEELKKELEGVIKQEQSVIKIDEKLAAYKEREIERTRDLNGVLYAISNLGANIDNFADSINTFDGLISGNVGSFKFNTGKGALDNVSGTNNNQFNAVTKSIGSFFGETGKRLSDEIQSIPDVVGKLPSILLKLSQQNTFDESKDFTDRFKDELGDIPDAIKVALAAQVDNLIGREAKPDKLLGDIEANRQNVADLIAKALDPMVEVFKKASGVIDGLLTSIEDGMRKYRAIALEVVDRENKILDTMVNRDTKLAELNNNVDRSTFDNQIKANRAKIANTLGSNASLIDSPKALGAKQLELKRKIDETDTKLRQNPSATDYTELIRARTQLVDELGRVTKGLDALGDATQEASLIEAKYNFVRAQNQPKRDVIKDYTFGNSESRLDINKTLAAVAKLTTNQDINSIPQDLRAGVLSMLEKFGNSEIFGIKASDLLKGIQSNYLQKNFGFTKEQADSQVNETDEENELKRRLIDAYNRAINNQQASTDSLVGSQGDLRDAILLWIETVKFQTEKDLVTQQKGALETANSDTESRRTGAYRQRQRITSLSKKTGFNLAEGDNLNIVRNNLENFNNFKKNQKTIDKIKSDDISSVGGTGANLNHNLFEKLGTDYTNDEIKKIAGAKGGSQYNSFTGMTVKISDAEARQNQLNIIKAEKLKELEKTQKETYENLTRGFSADEITKLIPHIDELSKTLGTGGLLDGIKNFETVTDNIGTYTESLNKNLDKLKEIADKLATLEAGFQAKTNEIKNKPGQPPIQKARGGMIPGVGTGDTVPAMLTPGEFVLTKKTVKRIGESKLHELNSGKNVQTFVKGGKVKPDFVNDADEILKKFFGFGASDAVNNRITNNISARGEHGRYSHTSGLTTSNINIGTGASRAESASTLIHESIHAIDVQGVGKGGGAPDVNYVPRYRGEKAPSYLSHDPKTPLGRIAKLFGDEEGLTGLLKIQGHSYGDILKSQPSYIEYFKNNQEVVANTLQQYFSDPKGLEAAAPKKYKELLGILPDLQKHIGSDDVLNSIFSDKHDTTVARQNVVKPKPFGKTRKPRVVKPKPIQGPPPPIGPPTPFKTRGVSKPYVKPRPRATPGPKVVTPGGLLGRKLGNTTIGKAGKAIGNTAVAKTVGKGFSKLGGVTGIGGPLLAGVGAYADSGLIDGRNSDGKYVNKPARSVEFLGNQLMNSTVVGGLGSGAGGYLHNAISGLTGTETVKSGETVQSILQDTADINEREIPRGKILDTQIAVMQEKRAREKEYADSGRKAIDENRAKAHATSRDKFRESQNEKARLGEANYQNSVYSTDIQRKQIEQNSATLAAPSTSKMPEIMAQEEERKAANKAKDDKIRESLKKTYKPVNKASTYSPSTIQDAPPKPTKAMVHEDAENKRIQGKYGTPEEYKKESTAEYNKVAAGKPSTIEELKKQGEDIRKKRQATKIEKGQADYDLFGAPYKPDVTTKKAVTASSSNTVSLPIGKQEQLPSGVPSKPIIIPGGGIVNLPGGFSAPTSKPLIKTLPNPTGKKGGPPVMKTLPDKGRDVSVPSNTNMNNSVPQADGQRRLEEIFGFGGGANKKPTSPTQSSQSSGSGVSKSQGMPSFDMDLFSKSVGIFNTSVGDLSKVLNAFPHTIQLEANHKVEVVFNGAEVLTSLLPQIQAIAVSKAEEALSKYTQKNNLPPVDATSSKSTKGGSEKGGK